MKSKFSLLINLATLVLCISAIAIGVYSAKQASLNVSGTVGFVVHNCEVGVVANLYGFGKTADATSVVAKDSEDMRTKSWAKLAGNNSETNSWEFSNSTNQIYFVEDLSQETAKAYDVTLELNITNLSAFKISATLNFSTMFSTDEISVRVYQGTSDTTGVEIADTASTAKINLGTTESNTIKVVYTLKVNSTTSELYVFESKSLGEINVSFAKFSGQYRHDIIFSDYSYGENDALSITIINNDETNYTGSTYASGEKVDWKKALENSIITFNSSSLVYGFPPAPLIFNLFSDIDYFVSTLNSSYYKSNKDNIKALDNIVDIFVEPCVSTPPPGFPTKITSIESCTFDEQILNNSGNFNLILSYNQGKTARFESMSITSDSVTEL